MCLLLDKTKSFIWFNIRKNVGLQSGTRRSINFLLHVSLIDEAWLKQSHGRDRARTSADNNSKQVSSILGKRHIACIQTLYCLDSSTTELSFTRNGNIQTFIIHPT